MGLWWSEVQILSPRLYKRGRKTLLESLPTSLYVSFRLFLQSPNCWEVSLPTHKMSASLPTHFRCATLRVAQNPVKASPYHCHCRCHCRCHSHSHPSWSV